MQGVLKKMQVRLDSPVQYEFIVGEQRLALNTLIGKPFKFSYTGNISCVNCSRSIKKSFNQGYCYPCFISLAEWVEIPTGVVAQIVGHKPSATAERHYKHRPLELLEVWHSKFEAWILKEAGVEFKNNLVELREIGGA